MLTVTTRGIAALLLLVVLAMFPIIAALPHQIGAIRLAGISLLWWFGGVIAPMLAAAIAVALLPGPPPPSRPE
jgi:hypothetical protein